MLLRPLSISYCNYSNFHHDPNPLLFVLSSDSRYTTGINIHYLPPAYLTTLLNIMRQLTTVQGGTLRYNGKMVYEILKRNATYIPKMAFRKYFSVYLAGTMVNEGLNPVNPLMQLWLRIQNMVSKSTSNYMQTRAKNDNAAMAINKVLYDRRAKAFKTSEDTGYKGNDTSTGGLPDSQTTTPDEITPDDIRSANQPPPGGGYVPD